MAFRKDAITRVTLILAGAAGLWVAWAQQQPRQALTMEKVTENLWSG